MSILRHPGRKKMVPNCRSYFYSLQEKARDGSGVHFDVAVTTQTIDEGQGGAKVRLAVFEADLGGKLKSSEQAVSRIHFSVNVDQWHG